VSAGGLWENLWQYYVFRMSGLAGLREALGNPESDKVYNMAGVRPFLELVKLAQPKDR
jgi:hypothetical protein